MSDIFTFVTVYPDFAKGHLVQWTLDPTFVPSAHHSFIVEVSDTPIFSEMLYTLDAQDSWYIRDNTNTKQSLSDYLWYRVRLQSGDKEYLSQSIQLGVTPTTRRQFVLAAEISRKEMVRASRFTGTKGYLLKRKSYGKKIRRLVDPVTQTPLTTNVEDQGTGYEDGYHPSVPFIFTIEQQQREKQHNMGGLGVDDNNVMLVRTIGYPVLDVKDIIVDARTNYRYLVRQVNRAMMPGTTICVVQTSQVTYIPSTDNVYKIETQDNAF